LKKDDVRGSVEREKEGRGAFRVRSAAIANLVRERKAGMGRRCPPCGGNREKKKKQRVPT